MRIAAEQEAKKKASGKVVVARSAIVLDVKPWDDTTDMKELEEKVRAIKMDGLEWKGMSCATRSCFSRLSHIHSLFACLLHSFEIASCWLWY
jgi:hypothetical protein